MKLISCCYRTFVAGRRIFDGILVVKEIIELAKVVVKEIIDLAVKDIF
jgi:hypothetical protein